MAWTFVDDTGARIETDGAGFCMEAAQRNQLEAKLDAFALWAALPEDAAAQIVPRFVPGSFSYTRDAAFMESLAEAIESADDLVTDD